ncbi:MAG: hypothetical protein IT437_10035 [Phycisphaerales bacterium]|nr:hypothetical protein [Phycisphaerales bacterium]
MKAPEPRRRWIRRTVLAVLVAVLCGLGSEVYRAFAAVPGTSVDYFAQWDRAIEDSQPVHAADATGNAWDSMQRATRLYEDIRGQVEPGVLSPVTPDFSTLWYPLTDGECDANVTYPEARARAERALTVAERLGVFAALAEAAAQPRAVRTITRAPGRRMSDTRLSYLPSARTLARLEAARMFVAARDGDDESFTRAYEEMLAIARISAQQGTLSDRLVADGIRVMANERARVLLPARPRPAAVAEAMLAAMDRQAPPPWELTARVERIQMLDSIQWMHTARGRLILTQLRDGAFLFRDDSVFRSWPLSVLAQTPLLNLGSIGFASRDAVASAAERYAAWLRTVSTPRFQRPPTALPESDRIPLRLLALRYVAPSPAMTPWFYDSDVLSTAGTRVLLAVELFRARHGAYPESVAELVPMIPAEALIDPWSGSPFIYKRLDAADDPFHRAYVVYAVGADGMDDGGVQTSPVTFSLNPRGRNTDYVFSLPASYYDPPAATGGGPP